MAQRSIAREPYISRDTSAVIPPEVSITAVELDEKQERVSTYFEVEGQSFKLFSFAENFNFEALQEKLKQLGREYIVAARRGCDTMPCMIFGRKEFEDHDLRWPEPDAGSTWLRTEGG